MVGDKSNASAKIEKKEVCYILFFAASLLMSVLACLFEIFLFSAIGLAKSVDPTICRTQVLHEVKFYP
jgi:hypothetical protein